MNAKRSDKIATGVLYIVSGIIVLILAALLLSSGNTAHFMVLLDRTFQSLPRRRWNRDPAI